MYFNMTEDIVLIICIILYLGCFLYFFIRPFVQERDLKRTEFKAEIDILSKKSLQKEKEKEIGF
ncbi:DUF3966 domain-containing protein [Bacillus sp. 165]|uniref:DUF3966 domain-containing protein n=1 Tax=Bacillus sp. 165 TaxID=1529117 RepID=UPI001AD9B5B4|nr:DUF3966 domain-containing protein [Bacillus sp. 165]MBO9129655.1 DUF3966 domain-containing protein [Bacillus sp. 165]